MQYKIHTTPVWDAIKSSTICPFCSIANDLSLRLIERFLNEAVMVPTSRELVNKYGFCARHFDGLVKGDNILGVSLQSITRTEYLLNILRMPDGIKEAKKLGDEMVAHSQSCVICNETDETMERYYITAAQMFLNEPPFVKELNACNGFCLFHFGKLMQHARHAEGKSQKYIDTLYSIEATALSHLKSDLTSFSQKFDYQKKDVPWGNSKDAPMRASKILTRQI